MFYNQIAKAAVTIEGTANDMTFQTGRRRVVSMEDPGAGTDRWVYTFYINSSGHLGYKKSTNNGTSFGAFQTIDAVPADYKDVSIWYDRWTKGGLGNIIHVVGANATDQGLRYFQIDTNNTDTVAGDLVALTGTAINFDAHSSVCVSWDGTLYVSASYSSAPGVRMASSTSPTSSWTDRGLVLNSSHASDRGILFPAKTDNDVMMVLKEFAGTDTAQVIRWDAAVGLTWSLVDASTIPITNLLTTSFAVVHEPVDGDSFLVFVTQDGTHNTFSQIRFFFFDESANTVTARATVNLLIQSSAGNILIDPSLSYDTFNGTLICGFMWGSTTLNIPQLMFSYDGGNTFGDPMRAVAEIADDHRSLTLDYHLIDELGGLHCTYNNDDLNSLKYFTYILDRISGNVIDNAGIAAPNVDVMVFSVSPDANSFSRSFQGRAISDSSGDWAVTILDVDDSNVEIQMIYDEDLTSDEVDASHRIAVDSI